MLSFTSFRSPLTSLERVATLLPTVDITEEPNAAAHLEEGGP
ncbi:hypothetical protein HNQ04_000184 [Deinococcus radiopugnans ATCC 19172]|uniref:Uncharacterized protein n=1 Tax=Deinococcus radiopugnans ATCC 19172 TaxID=585398 RepID=A0ABR6NLR5_9DEIO|nr:hypothetical protein [Deinococcus radiopugnans ATCC 19172]